MKRQLYYLLPNINQTQAVCDDLKQLDIDEDNVHVVMNEMAVINGINNVHSINETDYDGMLEKFLWRMNLAIFGVALLVFIAVAIWLPFNFTIIPSIVMVASYISGMYFSTNVPKTHWNEFYSALHHGEVLLIVDTSVSELSDVDHAIHRQHPEAVSGGVCWKL